MRLFPLPSAPASLLLPLPLLLLLPLTASRPIPTPTLHDLIHTGLKLVAGAGITACACGMMQAVCELCARSGRYSHWEEMTEAATPSPQISLVERPGGARRHGWGTPAVSSASSPSSSAPASPARSAGAAHAVPPAHSYAQLPATSPGHSRSNSGSHFTSPV